MALRRVRLELARSAEFPDGSAERGCEFVAPLSDDGHLDAAEWRTERDACTVHRFWAGEDDEWGRLVHHRGDRWAFWYEQPGHEGEEPIFRFDRHCSPRASTSRSPSTTACNAPSEWSRSCRCCDRRGQRRRSWRPPEEAAVKGLRIVLVPLFGTGTDTPCLDAALTIADRFGAHVQGLFVGIDPLDAIPVIGEGVSPAVIEQLTRAAAAEMERQGRAARATFPGRLWQAACPAHRGSG
jgi:hypothetical protein